MRAIVVTFLAGCGFAGRAVVDGAPSPVADAPAGDVAIDAVPCVGPAVEWTFDEDGGPTAADTTNHHALALTNATWTAGHASTSALSLGGSGYGTTPYDPSFAATTALSVTAWLQPGDIAGHGGMIVKAAPAGPVQDWGFYEQQGELGALFNWPSATSSPATSSGAGLQMGVWSFVAFVYDGAAGQLTYYKDGQPITIASAPASLLQNPASITIGVDAGTPSYVTAAIDSVSIWQRVLTASEVATVYAGGCLR